MPIYLLGTWTSRYRVLGRVGANIFMLRRLPAPSLCVGKRILV
jgi:hypothetical protein